jgi:transcription initiation factor TFIIIB Brf1 subunit/transcription initiation factor TFIIB
MVLAQKLDCVEKVKLAAVKIWENIERLNFIKSIHAVTLAACCLRFACALNKDEERDFGVIASAAGITKMTLKNMYRELFPYRYYFITPDCLMGADPKDLKKEAVNE